MWAFIALLVITVLAAVFLAPQPDTQPVVPEKTKIATASEGDIIPVIFGTRDVKSINVVWYGDTKAIAIRKKGGKK